MPCPKGARGSLKNYYPCHVDYYLLAVIDNNLSLRVYDINPVAERSGMQYPHLPNPLGVLYCKNIPE